jgi:hypothetical protein
MGIVAEFQGSCRNCDDSIEPGQEIEPAGGWWRHVVCPRTADITSGTPSRLRHEDGCNANRFFDLGPVFIAVPDPEVGQ